MQPSRPPLGSSTKAKSALQTQNFSHQVAGRSSRRPRPRLGTLLLINWIAHRALSPVSLDPLREELLGRLQVLHLLRQSLGGMEKSGFGAQRCERELSARANGERVSREHLLIVLLPWLERGESLSQGHLGLVKRLTTCPSVVKLRVSVRARGLAWGETMVGFYPGGTRW